MGLQIKGISSETLNHEDFYLSKIERALAKAKEKLKTQGQNNSPDFDIRGDLYRIALELAPNARAEELNSVLHLLKPKAREIGVDLAAGTGFLSLPVAVVTHTKLYAVDVSSEQLRSITSLSSHLIPVHASPDSEAICKFIPTGTVDFITSLGGLHHVSDQRQLFKNVTQLLKPKGRFVAADVCADSKLSAHFDRVVSKKCITGHEANWLSRKKIIELAAFNDLEPALCTQIEPQWVFRNIRHACLFFKALHAYDIPIEEIEADLRTELDVTEHADYLTISWPLIIFELRKRG